jgi:hypothetical protein
MRVLLALLLLIPSLSLAGFNEYKIYLSKLDTPLEKVVTCFRMYDILSSSVELATHDLILKNQLDKAQNLLGSFHNNKARAIFINKLAEQEGLIDIMNKSYEVGAETDYFAKNVQKFITPICVKQLNSYMKEYKDLSDKSYDESGKYINKFLEKHL